MANELAVINRVLKESSKEHLDGLFSQLADSPITGTKAEIISSCLNSELGAYGFQTYTSPDRTMVLINDETMCHLMDFFKGTSDFQPHFTKEKITRIKAIQTVANANKISIHWEQIASRRNYYYFKQFAFNGLNLFNVLNVNSVNMAAAAVSPTGAATLTMTGVIALSYSLGLSLSLVEKYIPNSFVKTKAVVSGAKFLVVFPVSITEWTANLIFNPFEYHILGAQLPINVTDVFRWTKGPNLRDLGEVKKAGFKWLINKLQDGAN